MMKAAPVNKKQKKLLHQQLNSLKKLNNNPNKPNKKFNNLVPSKINNNPNKNKRSNKLNLIKPKKQV